MRQVAQHLEGAGGKGDNGRTGTGREINMAYLQNGPAIMHLGSVYVLRLASSSSQLNFDTICISATLPQATLPQATFTHNDNNFISTVDQAIVF